MKPLYIFIIVFVLLVLSIIGITVYFQYKPPYCGDQLNKKNFLCNSASEEECNPTNTVQYYDDIVTVIRYIMMNYEAQRTNATKNPLVPGESGESVPSVTYGVFYYAISELLRVMPTDFGQNSLSPYGFSSFFPIYPTCISDVETFCAQMFPSNENSEDNPQQKGQRNCEKFLNILKKRYVSSGCPFPIKDDSKNLFIGDPTVFNQFGMLGSTSMDIDSGIIIRICLPLQNPPNNRCCEDSSGTICVEQVSLALSYWSFALYKMESMDASDICYPNYQVNAASLCAPLNMYNAVAEAYRNTGLRKDPLRDTFKFAILINYCDAVDKRMRSTINDQKSAYYDFDFVYTMKIPCSDGSLPLSKDLPNPNLLSSKSTYFDPKTDRFGMISRLVEDQDRRVNIAGYTPLDSFVNMQENTHFTVQMWKYDFTPTDLYPFQPFPPRMNPPVNEKKTYGKEFRKLKNAILNPLEKNAYIINRLTTRNNLVNITAPFYPQVRNGKIPYRGGYQAVQMAGNMQGDNPDAQYRLQQAECLDDNSVLITICVNHQNLGNSYYNSLNITDGYQAYGFYGYDPGPAPRYIVFMTGRKPETLKMVEKTFRSGIDTEKVDIHFKTIITDKTQAFGIPACHPVLMIERIYLNPLYASTTNGRIYNINELYTLTDENQIHDRILSLSNVTGPELDYYIEPCYYKITQNTRLILLILYTMVVVVFFALLLGYFIHRYRSRRKQK